MPTETRLFIKFFGNQPSIVLGDQTRMVPLWSSAAILVILAMRRGQAVSRTEVAELIWPDFDSAARLTNLRQAIKRLRELPEIDPILLTTRSHVEYSEAPPRNEFDELDLMYRAGIKQVEEGSAPEALEEYWKRISEPLFSHWPAPFFEAIAMRFRLQASELGLELATKWEEQGNLERAQGVLERLLFFNPTLVEATKHQLRLEYLLKGEDSAMNLASTIQKRFLVAGEPALPVEVERMIASIRRRKVEPLPKPDVLEKRSHILLLTRLFEDNLKAGDQASLDLLVSPASEAVLREHPRAFLGLAEITIRNSHGYSESRCKLIWLAIRLSSFCSEYVRGTTICDLVLTDPNAPVALVQSTLRMKAFMLFEQRRYGAALEGAKEAVSMAEQAGLKFHRIISVQNLGGILAHMGEFEQAEQCFDQVMSTYPDLNPEEFREIEPIVAVNRCLLYAAWNKHEQAIQAFEYSPEKPGKESVYRRIGASWYGYSLIRSGKITEGASAILSSVADSHQHGFRRQLQIGIDFLAASLGALGSKTEAQTTLDACAVHRKALHHDRSNLEIAVIQQIEGLRPNPQTWETALYANDPLSSLVKFGTEALERAVAHG